MTPPSSSPFFLPPSPPPLLRFFFSLSFPMLSGTKTVPNRVVGSRTKKRRSVRRISFLSLFLFHSSFLFFLVPFFLSLPAARRTDAGWDRTSSTWLSERGIRGPSSHLLSSLLFFSRGSPLFPSSPRPRRNPRWVVEVRGGEPWVCRVDLSPFPFFFLFFFPPSTATEAHLAHRGAGYALSAVIEPTFAFPLSPAFSLFLFRLPPPLLQLDLYTARMYISVSGSQGAPAGELSLPSFSPFSFPRTTPSLLTWRR